MNMNVEYGPDGMLMLRNPVTLPGILDLLVVGGGPAGTAAAFHGLELGLSVLVIDYDDLMKRIRDYPKDKLILPDFGGGDQMGFPKGGELVSLLAFSPMDKDEMVNSWKSFYHLHNVPAQIGIELLGMERDATGVWGVKVWNHNTKGGHVYRAKHVAIGIGRGVPRRFDIPGNTDGIAFRLTDASMYVGEPALVIGGGTSAAEAVIAVSQEKAKSGDSSAVYWAYRGDKLPKVSKALADVFFEAYMGNGNIRYFPNSEPVAVLTADDRREYLSLRTDRKAIAGRPNETVHLEFRKERCIACIGEDIPEALLNTLGIAMATGGPSNKKRMVVSRILETRQPNVYLIGDILSQAYLETDDFNGDPSSFTEIKHRGNIKAALRDGVLVAKVAAQKISGKQELEIDLDFQDVKKEDAGRDRDAPAFATIFAQSSPQRKETQSPRPSISGSMAYLIRVLPGGTPEEEFQLKESGVTSIGRKFCEIVIPDDDQLSDRHASLSHEREQFLLRDDGSETGVFLRLSESSPREVGDGDLLRIGRQYLLFRVKEGDLSFTQFNQRGERVDRFPLPGRTVVVGREAPDITLDPADMALSRRHMSIAVKGGSVLVRDLKSLNGTFLKVRDAVRIDPGSQFRMGRQTFMLALQQEPPAQKIRVSTRIPSPAPAQKTPAAPPVAPAKGLSATFRGAGGPFPFVQGQTVCDIAEKNGIRIVAECHAGICGSDPVRIHLGEKNLNPLSADEKGTLEDICGLQPGECRLACMVRPTGPVEVEIIGS